MSFSALDRYYIQLFEVNLDFFIFLFFIVKKRLNNMARQHTIPWNKVRAVPSILHTVGVNWNTAIAAPKLIPPTQVSVT